MSSVTITLTDDADGKITVAADFGAAVDDASTAHQMGAVLLRSVLDNAGSFQQIEDTAPELNVEPQRIITTEGQNDGV